MLGKSVRNYYRIMNNKIHISLIEWVRIKTAYNLCSQQNETKKVLRIQRHIQYCFILMRFCFKFHFVARIDYVRF